jgi:hypothetical protein
MPQDRDTASGAADVVRILSAGLGLDRPMSSIPDDVVELVRAGRTADAVKALRHQAPGRLSLRAAKRMVDALAASR